ncbi:MAG TPA: hypothetical protein PK228_18670 [Saprospiraceae bacterium]|nr:hypothetical protein [Saprospiraceae bacterium]
MKRSFYYPVKKVPAHWLDKVAFYHESIPPDSVWNLFLPEFAQPTIRKIKLYTKNLDDDASLEKILWCETDDCSTVYCFDERNNDWFIAGITGPDFLGNEPEYINNRPFIILPVSIATSDHHGEHLQFFRLIDGHLKQVFDLWRQEVLFPEGPGYTSKLYSTFRITNDTTIEVVYKFYYYGEDQKRGNQKPTIRKTKHSKFTWDAKKQEFLPVTESGSTKDLQDFIRFYKNEMPD